MAKLPVGILSNEELGTPKIKIIKGKEFKEYECDVTCDCGTYVIIHGTQDDKKIDLPDCKNCGKKIKVKVK
jgi:hypothetical protein